MYLYRIKLMLLYKRIYRFTPFAVSNTVANVLSGGNMDFASFNIYNGNFTFVFKRIIVTSR